MNNLKGQHVDSKVLLEIICGSIDEELERDILDFINVEIAIEERHLYDYLQSLSIEDVLHWLEEYQAKWNPSSQIFDIVVEELKFYCSIGEGNASNVNFSLEGKKEYWSSKENRLNELDEYIKMHGNLDNLLVDEIGKTIYYYFRKNNHEIIDALLELNKPPYLGKGKGKKYYSEFDNLVKVINWFIDKKGFFPSKNDFINILGVGQRTYQKHGTINQIKQRMNYNSINDLVDDLGYTNKSKYEYKTAQFLIHNLNISYKRDVRPFEKHKYECDFLFFVKTNVKEKEYTPIFVEVWGYIQKYTANTTKRSHADTYRKKFKKKVKLYSKYNIKLISIYGYDFDDAKTIQAQQEMLYKKFEEYVTAETKILSNELFITPKELSDGQIVEQLKKYSKSKDALPSVNFLLKNGMVGFYLTILERYSSYKSFAEKMEIDLEHNYRRWDKSVILEKIINMVENGHFISNKNIKKITSIDPSIIFPKYFRNIIDLKLYILNENPNLIPLLKEEEVNNLINIRDNKGKNIKNVVTLEQQKVANRILQKVDIKVLDRLEKIQYEDLITNKSQLLSDTFYYKNFLDIIDADFKLTPIGFNQFSKLRVESYTNRFKGSWLKVLDIFVYKERLKHYMQHEVDHYYSNSINSISLIRFAKEHPYITYNLIEEIGLDFFKTHYKHKDKNFNENDLKNNFLDIQNVLGRIPLYSEFNNYTHIGIYAYAQFYHFKGCIYDKVIRLYVSEEEYEEYLMHKKEHKKNIGKKSGSLAKRITLEELTSDFQSVFRTYKEIYNRYPSKREFNKISRYNESTYRYRLGVELALNKRIKWSEVVEYFGFSN